MPRPGRLGHGLIGRVLVVGAAPKPVRSGRPKRLASAHSVSKLFQEISSKLGYSLPGTGVGVGSGSVHRWPRSRLPAPRFERPWQRMCGPLPHPKRHRRGPPSPAGSSQWCGPPPRAWTMSWNVMRMKTVGSLAQCTAAIEGLPPDGPRSPDSAESSPAAAMPELERLAIELIAWRVGMLSDRPSSARNTAARFRLGSLGARTSIDSAPAADSDAPPSRLR
jgi:hypothetical protein